MASKEVPIYERHVSAEEQGTPNYGNAFRELGAAQNNLSAIGSQIAQSASNALAQQLGEEAGKTPHGPLGPSLTEFDKQFAQSYSTQSHATLALQADKLITDSNLEVAKAARVTPQLIAKSQQNISAGLQQIYDLAPREIKPSLQSTFGAAQLSQAEQLSKRMLSEQHQERRENTEVVNNKNAEQAHFLSANGHYADALKIVEATEQLNKSAVDDNIGISPKFAKTGTDTARIAAISGKLQYEYNKAEEAKKGGGAEYLKSLANKPDDISDADYPHVVNNLQSYVGMQHRLRSESEQLTSAEFQTRIATNPGEITGSDFAVLEQNVSPTMAEQLKFKYIQALKKGQSADLSVSGLINNFSNPEAQANSSAKTKNAAFNQLVNSAVKSSQNTKPLTQDEAEVQVAASAGSTIPSFVNSIKNKLHSTNPQYIESAAQQIHSLQQMDAGHALQGLNDQDHALYTMYESLRDSRDPQTAARDTTAAILNQDPAVQTANKQKWANLLHMATSSGITTTAFALNSFHLNEKEFINPAMAQVYGADILKKYSSLYQIANGDNNVAKKVTQRYIDDNYGETRVNGGSHTTMHPIEKVLGFDDPKAVPYIQQDVINQMNDKFMHIKKMYDENKSNEYWETIPLTGKTHGIFSTTFDPIQIKRHMRTDIGEKVDKFNVVLMGNDFDWDIAIQTDSGMRNIYQLAPGLGILNYKPNGKAIKENYDKEHNLK